MRKSRTVARPSSSWSSTQTPKSMRAGLCSGSPACTKSYVLGQALASGRPKSLDQALLDAKSSIAG